MNTEELKADRNMWLDYIGKLNDRALNRQRASGFTTWAIACVLALLVIKAIQHLPTIIGNPHVVIIYLVSTTIALNIFLNWLSLFIQIDSPADGTGKIKLKSRIQRTSSNSFDVLLYITLLALAAANIAAAQIAPSYLYRWPFWIEGTLLFLYVIIPPIYQLWLRYRYPKTFHELPILNTASLSADPKQRKLFYKTAFISTIVTSIVSLIPAFQSLPLITTPERVTIIIWSINICGLVFLSLAFCQRLSSHHIDAYLKTLERRIIIDSLSPNEIRSEFIREYLGEDIQDWLAETEKKLLLLHKLHEQASIDAEEQYKELLNISKEMTYEINGRYTKTEQSLNDALNDYNTHAKALIEKIERLCLLDANAEHPELFKQLLHDWNHQLAAVQARHKKVQDLGKAIFIDLSKS